MSLFLEQMKILFTQWVKLDWVCKERLSSPLFFSCTLLLLFNFALGDMPSEQKIPIFACETVLSLLLSLQLVLSRLFEPEMQDQAIRTLILSSGSKTPYFISKVLQSLLTTVLTSLTVLFLGSLFLQVDWSLEAFFVVFPSILISCIGLGSLGCLLTLITANAKGRDILFPFLFFLLMIPVLVALLQIIPLAFAAQSSEGMLLNWFAICLCFSVIYLTIGVLLFDEALQIL